MPITRRRFLPLVALSASAASLAVACSQLAPIVPGAANKPSSYKIGMNRL